MRPITAETFLPTNPPENLGTQPELAWLAIKDLYIDETYQRPIGERGRTNIYRIAREFNWSRFGIIVVSRNEDGMYVIVDGQHRAMAACLISIECVPCVIIKATKQEQAAAFSAINDVTTRLTRIALHKAAVAAGDPDSLAVEEVTKAANVKILAYPKSELNQEPGETMAVGALSKAIRINGKAAVILALLCIRNTKNDVRGGILAPIVTGLSAAIAALPMEMRAQPQRIIQAFNHLPLLVRESELAMRSRGKEPAHRVFARRIGALLTAQLQKDAA